MDGGMLEDVMHEGGFKDVRMEGVRGVLWEKGWRDLEALMGS